MAKGPLTVLNLSQIGLNAALDVGRWNACTAWAYYSVSTDSERAFLRLHPRTDTTPLSRSIPVSRAYDMDAPADGSELSLELPSGALEWSAFDVKKWLVPKLLELVPG
jgi:hypothetical protein